MNSRHRVFGALLVLAALTGVTRADPAPRLKSSWKERNARVEVFSPDGRYLVSSGGEGSRLRDAGTGEVLAALAAGPGLVSGAVFSPDGRFLFAKVSSDRHGPVGVFDLKVWEVAAGGEYATLPYISESTYGNTEDFALSGDGKTLAFLDNSERLPMEVKTAKMVFDGRYEVTHAYNASKSLPRVKVWDVAGWKERVTVDGGAPMAFSPDGATLVTGARDWHDPTAKVWDAATGRPRAAFDSGGRWMKPLVFSPDGKTLAIGAGKGPVLYEFESGRKWPVAALGHAYAAPVFSPDGRLLFPNGLRHMNPQADQSAGYYAYDLGVRPPKRLELESAELVISPDGRRYAAVRGKRGSGGPLTVSLHDLPSLRETGQYDLTGLVGAGFSPDGRWLALMAFRHETITSGTKTHSVVETRSLLEIRLLDPATARVRATIPSPGHTWGNYGWKFSPDGKLLAVDYRTGSNAYRPGDPDPTDRPMNVDIWELPPR